MNKFLFFLLKKRVETKTGWRDASSKTKVIMLIEGVLRLIEFVSPYLGKQIMFPVALHALLYALAVIAYRDAVNSENSGEAPAEPVIIKQAK